MNLITELLSPNVTKLISLDSADYLSDRHNATNSYNITCHKHEIFEFDFNDDKYKNVILKDFHKALLGDFSNHAKADAVYGVGVSGLADNQGIGSTRFCTMNAPLARWLTDVIKGRCVVDAIKDGDGGILNFVQVSQYFRFMKYQNGGEHFPHYDSDFIYPDKKSGLVTKYSLVMYFTDCETGQIAFCHDDRQHHKNTDWSRQAFPAEIYLAIKPKALKVLLFPHTLCHTVLPYTQDMDKEKIGRIICRGDLYFQKVN